MPFVRGTVHNLGMADAGMPPEVRDAASLPANRVGRYVRCTRLGSGGMGEVWKALDVPLHRWVSLKFLKGDDPDELRRFEREARTAANLNHPGIAAIHEVGVHQGRPFLAMQYVEGVPLSEVRGDYRLRARLVRDAARALHHAHRAGVIHRDVKPANLMAEQGAEGRVVVVDFGLARQAAAASSMSADAILGTPAYMAPEQAGGHAELMGPSVDIYALGATLYHLLAGRPPFEGPTVLAILKKVIDDDPLPPRRRQPKIPVDLETIVMKCLEKDPARRYADAEALAADLDRWLAGQPISARGQGGATRAVRWMRRRALAFGASSLLVVLGLAAWYFASRWKSAEGETGSTRSRLEWTRLVSAAERDLDVLRMKAYLPDFRLDARELESYEKLAESIHAGMKTHGPSADGWFLVARCREATMDYARAEEAYDRALGLDRDHARSLVALGRLRLERAFLRRRMELVWNPDPVEFERQAESAALLVRRAAKAERTADLEFELDVAEAWFGGLKGGFKDVEGRLLEKWKGRPFVEEFLVVRFLATYEPAVGAEVVRRVPSWAKGWFWTSVTPPHGSRAGFDRTLRIQPRFDMALVLRSHLLELEGKCEAALADVDQVLARDPANIWALANRTAILFRLGRRAEARAAALKALEIDPGFPPACVNLGLIHHSEGDLVNAEILYGRALVRGPAYAAALGHLANAQVGLQRWQAAIDTANRALAIDPDEIQALRSRASGLRMLGDFGAARADYDAALLLDPSDVRTWVNRAVLRGLMRDNAGAESDLDRALELAPSDIEARGYRAQARLFGGNAAGALADAEVVIGADPKGPLGWYVRGCIRGDQRRRAEALADFVKALEVAPRDWDRRAEVERFIEMLRGP